MIITQKEKTTAQFKKIVSLVPSITELLHHLNLEKEVTGITKFCIQPPEWRKCKTVVGGTKNVRINTVRSLLPDLVIASREENIKDQVEEIASFATVLLTDVNNYNDALEMIDTIGRISDRPVESKQLIQQIEAAFTSLFTPVLNPLSAAYLIWQSPYMAVGSNTYINDMLTICGFRNVFAHSERYPEVDIAQLQAADIVLLSTEPYPFKNTHAEKLSETLSGKKCMLVDGEMFSWYGSRMVAAAKYFAALRNELMM